MRAFYNRFEELSDRQIKNMKKWGTLMKIDFPFSDTPDTACFTCCHVLNGNKPILYVSHDEDGYWQFLCGGRHTQADAKIVSLAEILKIDSSMAALAELNYGEFAEAADAESDWVVKHG